MEKLQRKSNIYELGHIVVCVCGHVATGSNYQVPMLVPEYDIAVNQVHVKFHDLS